MPDFAAAILIAKPIPSERAKRVPRVSVTLRLKKTEAVAESPSVVPFVFRSENPVHDCILHCVRDQDHAPFWSAVENMSQAKADEMPLPFIPLTTRNPRGVASGEGWGGRWPVGMLGVTVSEAESVFAYARSFPEWIEGSIVVRWLKSEMSARVL